jgi:hypothetical protein
MTCQRGSAHGRLQVGILGAIKSECLGGFIGIGTPDEAQSLSEEHFSSLGVHAML